MTEIHPTACGHPRSYVESVVPKELIDLSLKRAVSRWILAGCSSVVHEGQNLGHGANGLPGHAVRLGGHGWATFSRSPFSRSSVFARRSSTATGISEMTATATAIGMR